MVSVGLLQRLTALVAGVLLIFMVGITVIDVVGRSAFGVPLSGVAELTELAMVGVTFLLYPQIAYRNLHISVDLLDPFFSRNVRRIQNICASVFGALIFGTLSWRLWLVGERIAEYGDVTAVLRVPLSPAYFCMSVLSGFTTIAFIAMLAPKKKLKERPTQ